MSGDVVVLRQFSGMPDLPLTAPVGGIMIVQPEEVGLSSQRLERMRVHCKRYIDAGKVARTLIYMARQKRRASCEPQEHAGGTPSRDCS